MPLRLGVDVGGTNTDAALIDVASRAVVGAAKAQTSNDVVRGIREAVQLCLQAAHADPADITLASLGTTSFVNAVVQRKGLASVALLRLAAPATEALPPYIDFPGDLRAAVQGEAAVLPGGFEFDGQEEISPLSEHQTRLAVQQFLQRGYRSFVVAGVNSPANSAQEERVAGWLREEAHASLQSAEEVSITLSHAIAGLGLLERENAAVLNATIQLLAAKLIPAFKGALQELGLKHARLFFSTNDGTLASARAAQEVPLLCFQSAIVNSLRGAAFLSGLQTGLVLDIGGTTSDVAVLVNGMPRPCAATALLAGSVRSNFPLPDVLSIGLGGGSLVRTAAEGVRVGPGSVGYELPQRAIACGGDQCTATDMAVALSKMAFGDRQAVQAWLRQRDAGELPGRAWEAMQATLEDALDAMKTSAEPVPLIVVGGGAALCGDRLAGISRVVRPRFADVANAIGAAIPEVSGGVDAVFSFGSAGERRADALQEARAAAQAQAVAEGADPHTCQVVVQDEIPLAYLPGGMTRVIVKVVGSLLEPEAAASGVPYAPATGTVWGAQQSGVAAEQQLDPGTSAGPPEAGQETASVPAQSAGPQVVDDGWILTSDDVEKIAIGCGILGTGGGGSPYRAKLKVLNELQRGGQIRVISPDSLPPCGTVAEAGYMGAPTVSIEKLDSNTAVAAMRTACAAQPGEQELVAVIAAEIGGGNGLEPLLVGSSLRLPVVDADYMGRAFPELQMTTASIAGLPLCPAALADEKRNTVVLQQCASTQWAEKMMRPICTAMGGSAALTTAPLKTEDVRRVAISHSLSHAWRLGAAVQAAVRSQEDPVAAVVKEGRGRLLFQGKVIDVQRVTREGFARGSFEVACGDRRLSVDFQNENLIAREEGAVLACVPDLVCSLDTQSGQPLQTEDMRFGLRISVVLLPAPERLRTPEALAVVGPSAFGYQDVEYRPSLPAFQPTSISLA